jgi:membrane dipeptidase
MVDAVGIDHVGWATDYLDGAMIESEVFNNYLDFPTVCGKLLQKGFSERELVKFAGGNALRVLGETTSD